jgi:two-component system cell cycle sensor histidine kinase/response regulator CckA
MTESRAKILVVEDERIVAEDIRRSLKKLGYDVCGVVSTGQEAIRKAIQLRPDLVLMDIVLRMHMNGIQAAAAIHEKIDVPVIYLTAYADSDTLEKAKQTEPYGYLLKPFENRELQTAIEMSLYKHRTERRLRENEAWLSTTLRSLAEGVIATNERAEILFMNPVAESLTGWTLEEVNGRPFSSVFRLVSSRAGDLRPIEKVLKSRAVVTLPEATRLMRKDGGAFDVDFHASPIRDERGRIFGAVAAFQDVTRRKRAEEDLKKSEREKGLILSSVSDMVVYLNRDLEIIWANAAAGRAMRKNRDRIKGTRCHQTWHRRNAPCADCSVQETLTTGAAADRIIETRSGRVWTSKAFPVRNDGGEVIGAVEIIRDVTEQKRAEEQLEKERDFINTLIQTSPAFYAAVDGKARILLVNQTLLGSAGYPAEEVIGKDFICQFVHPEDQEIARKGLVSLIRRKGSSLQASRIRTRAGGDIAVEWHGQCVTSRRGKFEYAFILGIDVTERKRAEKEKEHIENQLLQAQKMEAIGTLTGGVAHDFNNLLTAIQGCTDMAIQRVKPSDVIHRDLREVQAAAIRAAELTRQLLLFSSKHPTRFVPIDVNQTVGNLLRMLHRLIGEDLAVRTQLQGNLWTIRADKGTIEQVIMNLTVNARDAMPRGGRITIKTENVVLKSPDLTDRPGARPGEFVLLSVGDTGTGIPEDIRSRIFEPFFSTKSPGGGTGLGLSVVYGIVRQHDGWIEVTSEIGLGTRFDIFFPAVKERIAVTHDAAVSLESLRGNGERILAVEDSDGIQEFLRVALRENGYLVTVASNAEEAFRLYHQHRGNFDLIFSDVVLPDQSGIELVEKLLKDNAGLRILLSSGYTDHKSQWAVIQDRNYPFIQKPYSLLQLLSTVKEMIKK